MTNATARVTSTFEEVARNFHTLGGQAEAVEGVARTIVEALRVGGKGMFCGNGGSAAGAQHLVAELMGRYLIERHPFPAVVLNDNTSTLTAIGNGFDEVFARQVRGLGQSDDILVGFSTSGGCRNILRALEQAHEMGFKTTVITGTSDRKMRGLCDQCICVPSERTPRIQEMHIAVGHMICQLVEEALA